jgi:hypothetical protein
MNPFQKMKTTKTLSLLETAIIVLLASVPLFLSFPYRINIFLSWEGAYRLSQGHIPYKDFGMPLGYMYWVIPALFFKIFGAQLITLVKAQVFINILSGLAFRSILKSLDIQPGVRFLSVILYCISFSFFNFWPWYNHTVIVYEMIALAFLMRYFLINQRWYLLSLSALFTFFSFFTKQDGGGLSLMLSLALLLYYSIAEKYWKGLVIYILSIVGISILFILPLTQYNFEYWFNHGQPPHISRFSIMDLINEFLRGSFWIKFYLFLVALIAFAHFKKWKDLLFEKKATLFLLLTIGILVEAAIFQVTSYTPIDNNIFFHSFAFAFILSFLADYLKLSFSTPKYLLIGIFGLFLWWSGVFWKYVQRIAERVMPIAESKIQSGENVVNKHTYILSKSTGEIPMSQWTFSNRKSFEKIYMPKETVDGIERVINYQQIKNNKNARVLNMTELTPLAVEMPYQLEKGEDVPLWYHLGVSMFNKDASKFESLIRRKEYDLVLFEYIPSLNNFYPFRTRDSLMLHYQKIDSFAAPRSGDTPGIIEVYMK